MTNNEWSGSLWPHQIEAVKAVIAEIALGGRCRVTMACGTGKTLVGAEVSRQVAETGRVLVIAPTLELLAQTARSYVAHLGSSTGTVGAVCSDFGAQTMGAGELHAELDELHVEISTDPREVAEWTRQGGRLTVWSTYASLPVIAAASTMGASWDLIVIDEAHRSAGRTDRAWHIIHEDEAIPARRRLYMTATPRIIGTDKFETTSMDDAKVFGREVYLMPFARAIEEGLLADYKVLVTTMTAAELGKLDTGPDTVLNAGGPALPAQMLVAQLALLKAHAEYGVQRAITFHHRVASAKQFARTLPNAADLLPVAQRPERMYAGSVDGSMTLEERRGVLQHLDRPVGRFVVVSNARVLGEGVDVPELDCVVFADPRDSATDVVQAASRALRRGRSGSKTAYILIPVLLPDAETLDGSFESPVWDKLLQVVRALRAHDERLADELDTQRAALTAGDYNSKEPGSRFPLPSWLHLTGTMVDHTFADAVRLHVLEHTTSDWLVGYGAAKAFHAEHGHLRVHRDHETDDGILLGSWIVHQRHDRRRGELPADRVKLLDELDMDWEPADTDWRRHYRAAVTYFAEHDDLKVPYSYVDTASGLPLGTWVHTLRERRRKGNLSEEEIAGLDALGMVWDVKQADRDVRLAACRAFYAEHKHLRVRTDHVTEDGVKLGAWLKYQRHLYRRGELNGEVIAELEAAGMVWDPFQEGLAAAHAYRAEHGHLNPPKGYTTQDGFELEDWLSDQRGRKTSGHATAAEMAALDELDMIWNLKHFEREKRLTACRQYYAEHNHLKVPISYVTPDGIKLGRWVETQRQRYAKSAMSPKEIADLEALGMVWRLRDPTTSPLSTSLKPSDE